MLSCGKKTLEFTMEWEDSFAVSAQDHKKPPKDKQAIRDWVTGVVGEKNWTMCHKDMPIELTIIRHRRIPKSMTHWKSKAMRYNLLAPFVRRTGFSELVKHLTAAMAGVVYESEGQVFKINLEARYCVDEPHITVEVAAYFTNFGEIKEQASALAQKDEKKKGKGKSKK